MPNPTPDPLADRLLDRYRDAIIELPDQANLDDVKPLPVTPWHLTGADPLGDLQRAVEHAETTAAERLTQLSSTAEPRRGPQASPNTERHPPEGLRPGGHWACQRPNRDEVTSDTAFDFSCPDCRIVAEAIERVLGADAGFVTRTRSGVEIPTQLGVHDLLDTTRRHNPEGKDHRR